MNKALLVGINNYPGSPLAGCVNDVVDMANFLVEQCAFKPREVRIIADQRATTSAIRKRLAWLVGDAKPGDRLFFHYSGHGAQIAARDDRGEVDRLDEIICPVDFDWSEEHLIRDDEFKKIFSKVPRGVDCTWVSDSCHSGDLTRAVSPPANVPARRPKQLSPPVDIQWRTRAAQEQKLPPGNFAESAKSLHVGFISGCRSGQTAADAWFNGRPNGALTYFLLEALRGNSRNEPLTALVPAVRRALRNQDYSQEPQLEGATEIAGRPFFSG
jgi:metacaspase-1